MSGFSLKTTGHGIKRTALSKTDSSPWNGLNWCRIKKSNKKRVSINGPVLNVDMKSNEQKKRKNTTYIWSETVIEDEDVTLKNNIMNVWQF